MTDLDGRELVVECDKAEANEIFESPVDGNAGWGNLTGRK